MKPDIRTTEELADELSTGLGIIPREWFDRHDIVVLFEGQTKILRIRNTAVTTPTLHQLNELIESVFWYYDGKSVTVHCYGLTGIEYRGTKRADED